MPFSIVNLNKWIKKAHPPVISIPKESLLQQINHIFFLQDLDLPPFFNVNLQEFSHKPENLFRFLPPLHERIFYNFPGKTWYIFNSRKQIWEQRDEYLVKTLILRILTIFEESLGSAAFSSYSTITKVYDRLKKSSKLQKNLTLEKFKYLAFSNGVYNTEKEELVPFSSEYFVTNKYPFDYQPGQVPEKTLRHLRLGWQGNKDYELFFRVCGKLMLSGMVSKYKFYEEAVGTYGLSELKLKLFASVLFPEERLSIPFWYLKSMPKLLRKVESSKLITIRYFPTLIRRIPKQWIPLFRGEPLQIGQKQFVSFPGLTVVSEELPIIYNLNSKSLRKDFSNHRWITYSATTSNISEKDSSDQKWFLYYFYNKIGLEKDILNITPPSTDGLFQYSGFLGDETPQLLSWFLDLKLAEIEKYMKNQSVYFPTYVENRKKFVA